MLQHTSSTVSKPAWQNRTHPQQRPNGIPSSFPFRVQKFINRLLNLIILFHSLKQVDG